MIQVEALDSVDDSDHNWDDVRLLIREHLDDLIQNRLPKIVQKTQMTMGRIPARWN